MSLLNGAAIFLKASIMLTGILTIILTGNYHNKKSKPEEAFLYIQVATFVISVLINAIALVRGPNSTFNKLNSFINFILWAFYFSGVICFMDSVRRLGKVQANYGPRVITAVFGFMNSVFYLALSITIWAYEK